jgi:hypothetical protein
LRGSVKDYASKVKALESQLSVAQGRAIADWQDISTAPKDGSEVLLFAMGDMGICYWRDDKVMTGWTWGLEKRFLNPTHWQPLPMPPVGLPEATTGGGDDV